MNYSRLVWIFPALFLNWSSALADDVITNITSPIVSYQYPDDFGSEALTNGGIASPIASYQYYEWPGAGILNLQYSPTASYYYQFLDAPVLEIISTTRTPTVAEATPAWVNDNKGPSQPSQLEVFSNGAFTTNGQLKPSVATTVLTHGWIPTYKGNDLFPDAGTEGWPTAMAKQLRASGVLDNIVAWSWTNAATSLVFDPEQAGSQTPTNGIMLGQALLNKLGANYSHPTHFVGHSFGTLVNAYAANYLQGEHFANDDPVSPTPWPAQNMLMTLFDEAEIGADKNFNLGWEGMENWFALADALASGNGNYLNSATAYYHPLPKQFAWAENYVSAFGLLHQEAVNVILTNGLPTTASDPWNLLMGLGTFHFYPVLWYQQTVQTDNSAMGFVWPFLWSVGDLSFANAPKAGSVYLQQFNSSDWDLTAINWTVGINFQNARFQAYRKAVANSSVQLANNFLTANGTVSPQAELDPNAIDSVNWIFNLNTYSAGSGPQVKAPGFKANDASSLTNVPAYVWMDLVIPANAISLSFNYHIQGNWQNDSLVAALDGTNVLSLPASEIATDLIFSSGGINVSSFAGRTNEFFVGIAGGTSTNAQLTVENLTFSLAVAPTLQAQVNGNSLILSWPMVAQTFDLQIATDLARPISWMTLTNIPIILDLQNTITMPLWQSNQFYRLILH